MVGLDINHLRAAVTLLSLISFIAIVVWSLARRNQSGFAEAAQLPFIGDPAPAGPSSSNPSPEQRDE